MIATANKDKTNRPVEHSFAEACGFDEILKAFTYFNPATTKYDNGFFVAFMNSNSKQNIPCCKNIAAIARRWNATPLMSDNSICCWLPEDFSANGICAIFNAMRREDHSIRVQQCIENLLAYIISIFVDQRHHWDSSFCQRMMHTQDRCYH